MGAVATTALSTRQKLERAREAAVQIAQLSTEEKNRLLIQMANAIESHSEAILRANAEDISEDNLSGAILDRLLLTPERIKQIADSVRDVASLPDPVNTIIEEWTRPNTAPLSATATAMRRGLRGCIGP